MGLLFHTFGQGFILGIRFQESNFFESTSSDMNRLPLTGIDREEIRQSTRKQVRSRTPLTVGKNPHPNSSLSSYYTWIIDCVYAHVHTLSLARSSVPTNSSVFYCSTNDNPFRFRTLCSIFFIIDSTTVPSPLSFFPWKSYSKFEVLQQSVLCIIILLSFLN